MNEIFQVYDQNNKSWRPMTNKIDWSDFSTMTFHWKHFLLVAGSTTDPFCQSVEILDMTTNTSKQLPKLVYPSTCGAIAWDRVCNSVILVGGYQRREGKWKGTDEMYLLTNVGKEDSRWEKLPCKLPWAMADPEVLITDSHLYLLGCDNTRKRVMRMNMDHSSEACVWEDLEDLHSELKRSEGHGGAVLIKGKVMVFTLKHIMTLNYETKKWDTISIGGEQITTCIPRVLNKSHIIILMRCIYDGQKQTIMEMYDPDNDEWEYMVPTFRKDKEVFEASLLPWHFIVYHV